MRMSGAGAGGFGRGRADQGDGAVGTRPRRSRRGCLGDRRQVARLYHCGLARVVRVIPCSCMRIIQFICMCAYTAKAEEGTWRRDALGRGMPGLAEGGEPWRAAFAGEGALVSGWG